MSNGEGTQPLKRNKWRFLLSVGCYDMLISVAVEFCRGVRAFLTNAGARTAQRNNFLCRWAEGPVQITFILEDTLRSKNSLKSLCY
ncbi:hypothetical protein QL285_024452 [Trifolium repens]|nr:hypothetical protein QL285_024452 [Trifolium repens]